jgi:hypothetical protein
MQKMISLLVAQSFHKIFILFSRRGGRCSHCKEVVGKGGEPNMMRVFDGSK